MDGKAHSGLDAIPDPVVRFDRGLTYMWVNEATCRLSGGSREDFVGRTHLESGGEAEADAKLREAVHRLFETGEVQYVDLSYGRGPQRRWYETRVVPERDESGAVCSALVLGRDITHLKRVERDLGERVKELRCLYTASTALGHVGDDLDGALQEVCDAMPPGWQYPEVARARLVVEGRELTTSGFRPTEHSQRADVVVDGETVGFLELCYLEPREFIPEERDLIEALALRVGEALHRWRADRALVESREYYRALIEASADVIAIGDAAGRIQFVTPSCEALLGLTPDELTNTSVLELVHPDDVEKVVHRLARAVNEPELVMPIEYRVRHADGSYRVVETSGRNRLDDPSVRGLVTITRDVTERWELESQLQRAQKMEAVGRLAGGIAHDFNNVLTIIDASAEMLAEDLSEHDPRREDVDEILHASRRASRLTRRLLAFSRKQVMQPQLFHLAALVRDMEHLLRRLVGEDVQLVTELEESDAVVRADPGQLEQVLMNLVVNAREAMPRGGRLTISVSGAPADEAGVRHCCLEVSDTGCGMTDEVLERIFDPFFTTKEQGTGLGLATVYGIVEQSGGSLSVESALGRGSTFRVALPVAGAGEVTPIHSVRPRAVAERRAEETVLVVEDEAPLRLVACRILERRGYRVLSAESGEAALSIAGDPAVHIDLMVVDVVMPGMSGREVVEAIQRMRPGLPALYTSGYMDDAILQHGLERNTMQLLPKPFTPDTLAAAVRRTLDRVA